MLILYFGTGITWFLSLFIFNFCVVPLHKLPMATVAVVVTKIHNVTQWCSLFNCLSRKQASQNVHRWNQKVWVSKCLCQCWKAVLGTSANQSASPQIRKMRTHGLGLRICEPISYRKHLRICGKKLKSTANPQINNITGIVSAISKKIRFYNSMYWQIWVDVFKVQHPLTKFLCCGTITSRKCSYFYSKLVWHKVQKLPTSCFCEGKLRLLEVANGCTKQVWWHSQHV